MSDIDPDTLPWLTKGTVVFFALLGWGAAELDSLADFLSGDVKTRFTVVKKLLAALSAGIITGLCVLSFKPEWSKMAGYVCTFAAAYGGAAYLEIVWRAVAERVRGIIAAIFGGKPQ